MPKALPGGDEAEDVTQKTFHRAFRICTASATAILKVGRCIRTVNYWRCSWRSLPFMRRRPARSNQAIATSEVKKLILPPLRRGILRIRTFSRLKSQEEKLDNKGGRK